MGHVQSLGIEDFQHGTPKDAVLNQKDDPVYTGRSSVFMNSAPLSTPNTPAFTLSSS